MPRKRLLGTFQGKLIFVFVLTLTLMMASAVFLLTDRFISRSRQDSITYLELLNGQMLSNILNNTSMVENKLYNAYTLVGVPEQIRALQRGGTFSYQEVQNLQYALNRTLTSDMPFDFIYFLMHGGFAAHSGNKQPIIKGSVQIVEQIEGLFAQARYAENSYGRAQWVALEEGGAEAIYVIADVYASNPLEHVGKVAARVRADALFDGGLPSVPLNCQMLFFQDHQKIVGVGESSAQLTRSVAGALSQGTLQEGDVVLDGEERFYTVRKLYSKSWTAVGLIPDSVLQNIRQESVSMGVTICAAFVLLGGLAVLMMTKTLSAQLTAVIRSMDAVAGGDMDQKVPLVSHDDVGQLAVHFNEMTDQFKALMAHQVEEEKKRNEVEFQLLEYRYRALQTQINPHFIYNALETVNALAKLNGTPDISRVVKLIGRYFRQNAASMHKRFIMVSSELANLKDYAAIYTTIHGEALHIAFTCDPGVEQALLPTMILQPVLENAIMHGIGDHQDNSLIEINASRHGKGRLGVTVRDHGVGMEQALIDKILSAESADHIQQENPVGIGLWNVVGRLRLIFGSDASLTIESALGCGTCVLMEMPLVFQVPANNQDYRI